MFFFIIDFTSISNGGKVDLDVSILFPLRVQSRNLSIHAMLLDDLKPSVLGCHPDLYKSPGSSNFPFPPTTATFGKLLTSEFSRNHAQWVYSFSTCFHSKFGKMMVFDKLQTFHLRAERETTGKFPIRKLSEIKSLILSEMAMRHGDTHRLQLL